MVVDDADRDHDHEHAGGLLGGLSRAFGGGTASLIHLSTASQGQAAFCADVPGKVVPLGLEAGESIVTHKHAFLCAESSMQLAVTFTRLLRAGLVGGDGFVLQKLTGPGMAFVEMDGDAIEYHLKAGEQLLVEPGHVAMFDPGVDFATRRMKGIRHLLFSGESLCFARLTGPCRVWLNSMTVSKVERRVGEYLPGKGCRNGRSRPTSASLSRCRSVPVIQGLDSAVNNPGLLDLWRTYPRSGYVGFRPTPVPIWTGQTRRLRNGGFRSALPFSPGRGGGSGSR